MSLVELVFALIKIVVILGFCLGVGGALTWTDRRMSAMIQDRVGPNRARFVLPPMIARALFAAPPMLVAAGVAFWGLFTEPQTARKMTERILVSFELSVLVLWIGLALLTAFAVRRGPSNAVEEFLAKNVGDPRRVFYMGVLLHAIVLVTRYAFAGTQMASQLKEPLAKAGPLVLAGLLAACGVLAALKVPKEGFNLRLIGLLHTAADGLKMFFKEDFMPKRGDRVLHSLAPIISFFPVLVIFAVIPFGDVLCFRTGPDGNILPSQVLDVVTRNGLCADGAVPLQIADLDIGILFIFAVAGTGIIGAALAGWASDNKYSLLGGLRAAGQMVSYEVTLGITLVGAFMIYNTLRLDDMVRWQGENAWGIFVQPLAFFLFLAAALAENKRIPFDLPEGESEIVGFFTEYSGMKFGMFFFAEYVTAVVYGALMVTLFLGGWHLPFLYRDGLTIEIGGNLLLYYPMTHLSVAILQVIVFFTKVLAVVWGLTVIRWTLPRFRYDQLMKLSWRSLLPLSLANVVATAIVVLVIDRTSATARAAIDTVADLTQVVVAASLIAVVIAFVVWLLKPTHRKRLLLSSSAQMAAEQGGTKSSPMQA